MSVIIRLQWLLLLGAYASSWSVAELLQTVCLCLWVDFDGAGLSADDDAVQQAKQHSSLQDAASAAADVDVKDHEKLATAERQYFLLTACMQSLQTVHIATDIQGVP